MRRSNLTKAPASCWGVRVAGADGVAVGTGGELDHLRVTQAKCGAGIDLLLAGGGAALQHQIGAKELGGTQQHGAVQACAEITDRGAGGHGDDQCEEQHAQLTGASVTQ